MSSGRCPKEMSPHVTTVTKLCLKFMTFDPNYNYDDNEEEDEDSMDIEDGNDEGLWCVCMQVVFFVFFCISRDWTAFKTKLGD